MADQESSSIVIVSGKRKTGPRKSVILKSPETGSTTSGTHSRRSDNDSADESIMFVCDHVAI